MSDLRIGVVGFGARGYLAGLAHRPGLGARVVACAGPAGRARETAVARFGPTSGPSPTSGHYSTKSWTRCWCSVRTTRMSRSRSICCGPGSRHFVEKPLAITTSGADRVLTVARDHDRRLFGGHNLRYAPFVTTMRGYFPRGT